MDSAQLSELIAMWERIAEQGRANGYQWLVEVAESEIIKYQEMINDG